MRGALLVVAAALNACSAAEYPGPAPTARLVPSETGLEVAGTGLEIGFGRDYAGAVAAASRLEGAPGAALPGRCAVVRWESGLEMYFVSNAFVGWSRNGARGGDDCTAAGS